MVYCFDLDGTICTKTENTSYEHAQPFGLMVEKINKLYDEGHTIKINTARGGNTGVDYTKLTIQQLETWGVKFHMLIMGKPAADYYIDDKGITPEEFLGMKFRPW